MSVRDDTIRTLTMKDKEDDDDAACENASCLVEFQPPFPPAVAHRLLLKSRTAAIE